MAITAAVTAIVGTIASISGSIVQGQMQANAARAQAQAQAQNAMFEAQAQQYKANVEKMNADTAHQQANQAEEAQRRRFRALQAEAIAGMAQSGTDPTSGSNLLVLQQNETLAQLDALNIRYQGEQQARGLLAQSTLSEWNATASKYNAKNALETGSATANSALVASGFNAGSNLISGVGNAAYWGGKAGWGK